MATNPPDAPEPLRIATLATDIQKIRELARGIVHPVVEWDENELVTAKRVIAQNRIHASRIHNLLDQ